MKKMTKIEGEQNVRLNKICEQITKLEDKMDEKINQKFKSSEKEILQNVNNEIDERMERFKRRNNLIIYGLEENGKKDREEAQKIDEDKVKKILLELEITVARLNIARLGRDAKTDGKPRPVKVELENEAEKYKILKKASNIRSTNVEEFKKIVISGDMTLKQRELDKNLREELKERRMNGERNLKIRNGKVVEIAEVQA